MEPNRINEATEEESWVQALKEEFNQFERNQAWTQIERQKNFSIIGIKWVFRNKIDENGNVTRNNVWSSSQGYSKQEGIG